MAHGLSDTDLHIERMQAEGFARMSPSKRLALMQAMTRSLIRVAKAELRRQYPDAAEQEIKLRLASRWLPRELLLAAYGWVPDDG